MSIGLWDWMTQSYGIPTLNDDEIELEFLYELQTIFEGSFSSLTIMLRLLMELTRLILLHCRVQWPGGCRRLLRRKSTKERRQMGQGETKHS